MTFSRPRDGSQKSERLWARLTEPAKAWLQPSLSKQTGSFNGKAPMTSRVSNQTLTETVVLSEDPLTGAKFGSFQVDFLLCEADYVRLRHGDTWLTRISIGIFTGAIGFGISILPKFISQNSGGKESVSIPEWQAFAWVAAIGGITLATSFFLPNEKKKVLSRIANHFKSEPRTRQLLRSK